MCAQALQATTYDVTIFKRFRQLCGRMGLLPTSHIIPGKLIQTAGSPVARGGFGDVWEGIYNDKRVAIKALRIYKDEDVQKVKKVILLVSPCHPRLTITTGLLQGGSDVATGLPPQRCPVPRSFGGVCTPLHGVGVDVQRERAGLRQEKS